MTSPAGLTPTGQGDNNIPYYLKQIRVSCFYPGTEARLKSHSFNHEEAAIPWQSPEICTFSHDILNPKEGNYEASLSGPTREMRGGIQSWPGKDDPSLSLRLLLPAITLFPTLFPYKKFISLTTLWVRHCDLLCLMKYISYYSVGSDPSLQEPLETPDFFSE